MTSSVWCRGQRKRRRTSFESCIFRHVRRPLSSYRPICIFSLSEQWSVRVHFWCEWSSEPPCISLTVIGSVGCTGSLVSLKFLPLSSTDAGDSVMITTNSTRNKKRCLIGEGPNDYFRLFLKHSWNSCPNRQKGVSSRSSTMFRRDRWNPTWLSRMHQPRFSFLSGISTSQWNHSDMWCSRCTFLMFRCQWSRPSDLKICKYKIITWLLYFWTERGWKKRREKKTQWNTHTNTADGILTEIGKLK